MQNYFYFRKEANFHRNKIANRKGVNRKSPKFRRDAVKSILQLTNIQLYILTIYFAGYREFRPTTFLLWMVPEEFLAQLPLYASTNLYL